MLAAVFRRPFALRIVNQPLNFRQTVDGKVGKPQCHASFQANPGCSYFVYYNSLQMIPG
jgi:hypothetical protein